MGGDLRGGVAGDDDAVVAQQRDPWRGLAGTCRVRVTYRGDPAGQRDTRVDVVDDDRVVAEEAFRQRIRVGVARQRVGGQRVQVQHERLVDEGVEEDLDAGATAAAVRREQRRCGRGHHRVAVDRLVAHERVEQGLKVQRYEVCLREREQRHAARLDVEDAVNLDRGVAATGTRVLRLAVPVGDLDEVGEQLI